MAAVDGAGFTPSVIQHRFLADIAGMQLYTLEKRHLERSIEGHRLTC